MSVSLPRKCKKVLPDVVYPMTQENGQEYLTVSYEQFAPVLVEAIKDQTKNHHGTDQRN